MATITFATLGETATHTIADEKVALLLESIVRVQPVDLVEIDGEEVPARSDVAHVAFLLKAYVNKLAVQGQERRIATEQADNVDREIVR